MTGVSQLETFVRVAELGSFAKAAETMYISSTAVIKQINVLEHNLGLTLFSRGPRGVKLTAAGESFYQDARYLIQFARLSLERARIASDLDQNVIRIGSSVMTPCQFLVDLWPTIRIKEPNLKFQLISFENNRDNARRILNNLGQNIDVVAGIFDASTLRYYQCAGVSMVEYPLCCAISINHPLAQKSELTISDLFGQTLMIPRPGWEVMDRLRQDLSDAYPQINLGSFSFYNIDAFNQCEQDGSLLLAIPPWSQIHPLMKVIPVQWEYSINFGLMCAFEPSARVRRLIHAIRPGATLTLP